MTDKLAQPYFDIPFDTYWYDSQFVKFLIQFMAIFDGMKVKIGKNDFNSQSDFIYVPIRRGGADRIVNSILAQGAGGNVPLRLPLFSAEIVQIEKNMGRQKGREHIQRDTYLPVGGAWPDDIKVVTKKTPVPYTLYFDLSLYTSNDEQRFQIIEQILSVFDPDIDFQITDDAHKWNKLSALMFDGINFESSYPSGVDQKIIVTSFNFSTVVYLQTPIEYKKNFIKSIKLKLAALESAEDVYAEYVNDMETGPQSTDYVEIANIDEVADINNMKA